MKEQKKEKVKYICSNCKYEFEIEYIGWYPTKSCPKCKGIARMKSLGGNDITNIHTKKYKEPIAFWQTKKGIMASDGKGHFFDPKETRYDLRNDPDGWKAIGRKVSKFDELGRPNK